MRQPIKTLTYPAPRRVTVTTDNTWYHRLWTVEDVLSAKSGGARFISGMHNFANLAAMRAAGLKPREEGASIRAWIKRLSPRQLQILKEILTHD